MGVVREDPPSSALIDHWDKWDDLDFPDYNPKVTYGCV